MMAFKNLIQTFQIDKNSLNRMNLDHSHLNNLYNSNILTTSNVVSVE